MNPLTPIDVCNSALLKLGSGFSINSFDDKDAPSRACATYFPQARRKFLSYDKHDFSFATTEVELVAVYGKENTYQLPSDMIRIIAISGDDRRNFYIQKDKLITEIQNPVLIYVQDDPSLKWYPPDAVDAVMYYLTSNLATVLRSDEQRASMYLQMADQSCQKVATTDIRNLRLDEYPTIASEIIASR